MQANCFVFPSPKHYQITSIQKNVILIPREPHSNHHSLYNPFCTSNSFHHQDDFADYLSLVQQVRNQKRYKVLQLTKSQTEKDNTGTLQGNLNLKEKISSDDYIPCMFLPGSKSKIIVFFHANGEDLSSALDFLKMVNLQTKYPILAMQYRGYSIYEGQTNAKNIQTDAIRVLQFLQANNFTSDQIILFGRSIGCAVALTITQKFSVHSTILLSPFISLKQIARDLYGNCAGALIKQAFDNEQSCKKINCPLLIIHGSKDTLVPYQHSFKLMSGCQSYCRLKVIENMTHTKFNFRTDFISHFTRFMKDLE